MRTRLSMIASLSLIILRSFSGAGSAQASQDFANFESKLYKPSNLIPSEEIPLRRFSGKLFVDYKKEDLNTGGADKKNSTCS